MNLYKKKFNSVIVVPTFNNYQDIKKLSKYFNKSNLKNYFICFVDDSFDNKTKLYIKNYFKKNFINERNSIRHRNNRYIS